MRRRDLLAFSAAATSGIIAGRAWAVPQTTVRLLIVFLRGGYDATNVVIPTGSEFYYEARPTIQIAKPDPANPHAALPLDGEWSLHPALKESLYPVWKRREIAFVPYAGTDDLSRSHFETQDAIELGQPATASRNYGSGFMARLHGVIGNTKPIAFTDQVPLIFRGGRSIPNVNVGAIRKPEISAREAKLIEGMYAGQALASSVDEGLKVNDQVYRELVKQESAVSRGAVSATGFEFAARRIGRLMRAEYNLGFVDVGDWDTHVDQGAATGYLAGRLGELGRGLAGFADELGPLAWRDTVVVVISEFGRTFRENGDHGTDHGHGSTYWVLGGRVAGGRISGGQVKLSPETLNQNRDYPVLIDYRALIGGIAQRLYGLRSNQISTVFPAAEPKDLGLI